MIIGLHTAYLRSIIDNVFGWREVEAKDAEQLGK